MLKMELEKEVSTPKENPSLLGMFTSPGQQFERIREKPKIWVPLIIVSILYVFGTIFMALSMDESILAGQDIPEDQKS